MADPDALPSAPPAASGIIARYAAYLPLTPDTPRITLGEGSTPLVRAESLERLTGAASVHLKLESCNPTGSFKDRGMVLAVAKAIEDGHQAVLCASTGNTSASAAAYAARMGLKVYVLVPRGSIAQGKLAQAIAHGARILAVKGSFDDALTLAREITDRHPIALVNSVNPHRIQGQKTGAFEIVDALGDAPDLHCMPVGNAGNITAYWMGYRDYQAEERLTRPPRMFGFQAAGAAPLVSGQIVEHPETIATAIRIGKPASWAGAVAARDQSGGDIQAVSDDQILHAYRHLAREEGVFCEPASAACVAGLLQLPQRGVDLSGARIVCIITGSGLKDPDIALSAEADIVDVPVDLAAVEAALD
ncbi:MAG: threonine synthase [Chloroflexi bacterium]|nr:MAG: threonine synthase [Chloroflexota bacterium]